MNELQCLRLGRCCICTDDLRLRRVAHVRFQIARSFKPPQSLDEHLFDRVAFAMPSIVGRVRSHLTFQTSVNMTPQPVFGYLDKHILYEVIESVVSLGG